MSFVKIWIHVVWGTKNREPVQHIKKRAVTKEIYIDFINGHVDHVHCLFALNADITISKTIQLIKGESSFWANKNALTKTKLEWTDEYFPVSVSESMIDKVRDLQ